VRRFLVVANQTLVSEQLLAEVAARLAQGPCTFHLVVPATRQKSAMTWTHGNARSLAARRLAFGLARFDTLGATATGEVADENPMAAIADALACDKFDEILLSTLPPGRSRWLRQDLPRRAARAFGLPVTHITAGKVLVT
jgi:hypothetical protein